METLKKYQYTNIDSAETDSKNEILMRFSGGREMRLRAKSGLFIAPHNWNVAKGEIKSLSRLETDEVKELQNLKTKLDNLCNEITTAFANTDTVAVNKQWLEAIIDKFNYLEKYEAKQDKTQMLFFDVFDLFVAEMGKLNEWTKATYQKFAVLKNHLYDFDKKISFDKPTKDKLSDFVYFMQEKLGFRNSTIGKQIGFFKWFMRWATANGYNKEQAFLSFAPKLKMPTEKQVVFWDWDELMQVYNFDFANDTRLAQVRDVFCFCCFTSLRYSDVANLKRSNINKDYIEVVTIKTH